MLYKSLYTSTLLIFILLDLYAQKPLLTNDSYNHWLSLKEVNPNASSIISNDGKYVVYCIENKSKKKMGTRVSRISFVLQSLATDRKYVLENIDLPIFTQDSRYLIFKINGDVLGILSLIDNKLTKIHDVETFSLPKGGVGRWLAYRKKSSASLVLTDLRLKNNREYQHVNFYQFDLNGNAIIINNGSNIIWRDLRKSRDHFISADGEFCTNIVFNKKSTGLVFFKKYRGAYDIYYYEQKMPNAVLLIDHLSKGFPVDHHIENDELSFTPDDSNIFFSIARDDRFEKNPQKKATNSCTVWNYQDLYLNGDESVPKESKVLAVSKIDSPSVTLLNREDEQIVLPVDSKGANNFVLTYNQMNYDEIYWNRERFELSIVFISNGSRRHVVTDERFACYPFVSPSGKFICWYNRSQKAYAIYEVSTGITRLLSKVDKWNLFDLDNDKLVYRNQSFGIMGWADNDDWMYVYDQYDIWKIDPLQKRSPISVTHGLGRKTGIIFRSVGDLGFKAGCVSGEKLTIGAFNIETKQNGFWEIYLDGQIKPRMCIMEDRVFYTSRFMNVGGADISEDVPQKAKLKNVFIVRSMTSKSSPNLFVTNDFTHFRQITEINPELKYNWLSSQLIKWSLPDGRSSFGILYKPENFDSCKKYPIIFNYYEKRSIELNVYKEPGLSNGGLNIPWYVSNGYLVFVPDMQYLTGNDANSISICIRSVMTRLKEFHYIDQYNIGLQGHSFGGYETNVLVSLLPYFKAAQSSSSLSNLVSGYSYVGTRGSHQSFYQFGQPNQGVVLYDTPLTYVNNSPTIFVDKIQTPILLQQNKMDYATPFVQAVELFVVVKRLNNPIWLLTYPNEGHVLSDRNHRLDFTVKQQEFFEYFLRHGPRPSWMDEPINNK